MKKSINLIGRKFDYLTVIKRIIHHGQNKWLCRCKCGKIAKIFTCNLIRGRSKSCGCAKKEYHNMTYTKEYKAYHHMMARCYNIHDFKYKDYGARGIAVCDKWKNSFINFFKDMGYRPPHTTLGRINNDGNYCVKNCEWQNIYQQANNKRNNRLLSYNHHIYTAAQLNKILNKSKGYIMNLVYRQKILPNNIILIK